LGVEPGTDWMVIRAIWRRKLQSWHPDQGGDHEVWLRKTAAYTLLEAWEQFKA
jgi:curved DNA-binding protein CbpA